MTEATLDRTPSLWDVVVEQLRVVGLAIRREAFAAAVVIGTPTLLAFFFQLREAGGLDLGMDTGEGVGVVTAMLAVLFPLAVWKGEMRFGDSQLWSLPADHRRHLLIKTGVGWAWLMALIAAAMLWFILLTLLSGGVFSAEEMRLVILDPVAARAGQAGATESVPWTTPWWQWVLPFTAATAAYLLGSALLLASEHPWRWVAGVLLLLFVIGMVSEEGNIEWLNHAFERVLYTVLVHPLGLDTLLTGGSESLTTIVPLPSGERAEAWRALPSTGRWAWSTALWIGLGAAGLWAASFRHREH